jgi:diguanylate cyclase (GGDEF)-like protein/PAS domain S-box-containing protein
MAASGHHAALDRVVVSFRDIDARIAAQHSAVEAQETAEAEPARLRADLDSQIEPHITMRTVRGDAGSIVDFIYDDANPAALAYLGITMDQFHGMSLMQMYPSAAARAMRDMYSHTVETGEPLVENDYAYPNEMYAGEVRLYDLRGAKLDDGIALSWEDVTERHRLAQRVAESERRYRLLSENSSDVVYMVGPDRRVSWISPTVTTTLGWDSDELVGTSMYDLIHREDLPKIDGLREAVFRGEEIINPSGGWLSRFRRKDGTYTWMALKTTTIDDESGQFAFAVTGMRDVDDLVKERELADYQATRRQAILDTLLDPHVLLQSVRDESGTIVDFIYADANDAACEYNQTPREELIGMRLLDLLPGQAGTGMLKLYADSVESGRPLVLHDYAYPHEIRHDERRFDIRAVRVGDALSFTWRDVTDRYETTQRIAASEERYRLLAENSSDVVVRSRDGVMVWVSPSLSDALGWAPADWIGHPFEDFTHPDEIPIVKHGRAEVVSGSDSVVTLRMRNALGEYHWVEIHAGPATTAIGEPDGIVASFRIVDDEVEAQEQLEHRATYDDLTGALKRDPALAQLDEIGHHPRTPGIETGVLFIDVDDFKSVNDTWGHAAGDALLRSITERVQGTVRAEDTVARMGGDEFMITLGDIHDLPEAEAIAEKIRLACAEPVTTTDGVVATTVSIGVTLADPIESGDDLIARADKAMYAAKRAGRNRVVAVPSRSGRESAAQEDLS